MDNGKMIHLTIIDITLCTTINTENYEWGELLFFKIPHLPSKI